MAETESQELEVILVNEQFYRAFESLDIREMEKSWATDQPVKCIHPGWEVRSGWAAVRDSWVLIFNNTARISFEITGVNTFLHQQMAWVTCLEQVTTFRDESPQVGLVMATNLYLRKNHRWRMIHHHGSPVFTRTGRDPELN